MQRQPDAAARSYCAMTKGGYGMPAFTRTMGIVVTATSLWLMGCSDPESNFELKPEGPPEVLTVTVFSESWGDELATFCSTSEDADLSAYYCAECFRVRTEEECSATDGCQWSGGACGRTAVTEVSDAMPLYWYVRIVFDELLDPSIEDLVDTNDDGVLDTGTIENTLPVDLECGGTAIAYGGFYDPSGNWTTYPPGPALVVEAWDYAPTSSSCTVTIKDAVKDKDGETVPSDQRAYNFAIAPLAIDGSAPEDLEEGVDPNTEAIIQFNGLIDSATLGTNITMADSSAADVPVTLSVNADDPSQVIVTPNTLPLAENETYTVTITSPAASAIADIGGGEMVLSDPVTFSFTTGMLPTPDAG